MPQPNFDPFSPSRTYRVAPSTLIEYDTNGARIDMGDGLFDNTGLTVPKDTVIADYYGIIVTNTEFEWFDKHCCKIYTGMALNKLLNNKAEAPALSMIGLPKYPGSTINHKKYPNCYFKIDVNKWNKVNNTFSPGFISIITSKKIQAYEEFFVNYGKQANAINSV